MRLGEEAGADLFVSIHVNAAPSTQAHGVELFFLSIRGASDEAAQELARLENEAPSAAVLPQVVGEEEIPFSLSLRQSDTLLRSSRAAEVVLDRFVERDLAQSRGVRQANFAVLRSYVVPSILVELGFVSSPTDREALASADHRGRLAAALSEGIARYFPEFAPLRRPTSP
jgi:N-acetylmuramoyl-L-alanine amidase